MTNQYHNTNITRKPNVRFNPSIQQRISSTYRAWFLVLAFFSFIVGLVIVGLSSAIMNIEGDIQNEHFHLWVGIPLIVFGVVGLVCFMTQKKKVVIFFLLCAFIMMAIAAGGAMASGVLYWKDGWRQAKYSLDSDRCSVKDNLCKCNNIDQGRMPVQIDSCDNLKTVIYLLISQMAFTIVAFVLSIISIYLSFMSICCAPWMYEEWYDPGYDPDFPGVKPFDGNVKQVNTPQQAGGYY